MTDGHHFNNILLGGRGGTVSSSSAAADAFPISRNPGQFKVHSGGFAWKRQGGGKTIEIDKADVTSVAWMKVPRAYQLGVRIKDGLFYRFIGFREQDVSNLTSFIQKNMGISPDEKQLSVSGHNWGEIDIDGSMLSFMVGSKQAFEVSLADVAQTQMQGKTDVLLEFHVDDTTGANEKDSLMDMSFHVPTANTQFVGDENRPPAHILWETILKFADVGSSEEPVVTFEGIAILTPRGRYNVELHQSFLRLQGQANDFKIQYSSIVRLFLLPKSNNPHTIVVITLDPPIRKGQTLYPHIVIQFETELVVERDLALTKELLAEKYKDRLEETYKIEFVEFERHGAGGANMSSHYFDLLVKLKSDQEHLFRNIQRSEYHNLFNFINGKHLKIMNLGDGQDTTGGVADVFRDTDDDAVDPHLERIKNQAGDEESDEEDEDFVADKDDSGSPTDDSGDEESDASDSGGEKEKSSKKEASSSKPPQKRKPKGRDEEGSEKKKTRKKKDPNAPKRAMTPFMYFSMDQRAVSSFDPQSSAHAQNMKNSNPDLATTEIAKKLGEMWQKMSSEEKQPYVQQSQVDKKRYEKETAVYRGAAPVDADSGNESD
ncbi:hypothetical protein PR202_ga23226 [Eleusine coracana subsp. coracana]|uniref:FACT complex subunit SSRP1 n=1 Tax=Eleusine coracana subsp. coracana TaxID=191504 RepID=A0AAV5D5Q4_ELECO|nr:hypothetical protein PR202_ga23226 [Eleusine coracana subsp. coracana]